MLQTQVQRAVNKLSKGDIGLLDHELENVEEPFYDADTGRAVVDNGLIELVFVEDIDEGSNGLLYVLGTHLALENVQDDVEKGEELFAHGVVSNVNWKQPQGNVNVISDAIVTQFLGLSNLVQYIVRQVANDFQSMDDNRFC